MNIHVHQRLLNIKHKNKTSIFDGIKNTNGIYGHD
jgi:hypothetical protein